MSRRFKRLFWVILTEHAIVQVFMYAFLFLAPTAILLAGKCSFLASVCFGLIIPITVKLMSVFSSLLKAWYIIKRCNEGSSEFMVIYKDWTGKWFR